MASEREVTFRIRTEEDDDPHGDNHVGVVYMVTSDRTLLPKVLPYADRAQPSAVREVIEILRTTRYRTEDGAAAGASEMLAQAFVDAFEDPEVEASDLERVKSSLENEIQDVSREVEKLAERVDELEG